MTDIYALLVGIDAYPSPVPSLNGCRNDIRAVVDILTVRAGGDGNQLHFRTLLNEQATRAAVLAGFREHLAQAGADDVALFCYSGHGAQALAPEIWWDLEPDHRDETLVLYDSRRDGVYDLADKELAVLLAELAESGAHLLVVLDCCHSGSGTRASLDDAIGIRRAPLDNRSRPLDTYLFSGDRASAFSPDPPIESSGLAGNDLAGAA